MSQSGNRWHKLPIVTLALLYIGPGITPSALAESSFTAAKRFIDNGQITKARRALETELHFHPDNVVARYNLAVLTQELGDIEQAINLYRQNLGHYWHLPSLVNLSALLRENHKEKQAQQWLEKGTHKLRHESAPWYLLAEISEAKGNIALASRQLQKATQADPLNGFAWIRRAAFLGRQGDLKAALNYADKATRLLPECSACWRSYGDLLQQTERHADAVKAYQHSLAIEPDHQATRSQLITSLHALGRHQQNGQDK